jgi:hypothetical protein
LLQLRIRLHQIAAVALVFPGETVPFPNIRKAGAVADLPSKFLEGVFAAMPIDFSRFRYAEELT